ncbi:MAG: hypothetical protein KatS3mg009_2171 [Acidimicrobiia bacterium]|nr:MAG: hypothetical protein KatS3mg009_2171 [Acidimicrobiia bacterium]
MTGPTVVAAAAGRPLVVLVTMAAAGALTASVAVLLGRRQARVERRLAGYELAPAAASGDAPLAARPPDTLFVRRGAQLATDLAARAGVLARVERLLEQADVPVRAGELLVYSALGGALAFLGVSILATPLVGLLVAAAVTVAPYAVVAARRDRRLARFQALLPATLTLLASSLRAGFSLMQGLETVAEEAGEPVRREMQRVFTEVRLGRPAEDALAEVAERMRSRDLAWTVMAIRVQREVGGNLAALLDTVADTMTKRAQLRREVRTLTAEGRLSAVVLSLFPPVMGLVLWLWQPDYIERLFARPAGVAAVVVAAAANVAGWVWLRRIVDIED